MICMYLINAYMLNTPHAFVSLTTLDRVVRDSFNECGIYTVSWSLPKPKIPQQVLFY